MMRLHKILLTLVCFTVLSAHAQWKWLNPLECGFPVIQNQGWTEEIGDRYVRLPQRAEGKVRKPVWDLSRNSAGLAIHFFSNAPVQCGDCVPHSRKIRGSTCKLSACP